MNIGAAVIHPHRAPGQMVLENLRHIAFGQGRRTLVKPRHSRVKTDHPAIAIKCEVARSQNVEEWVLGAILMLLGQLILELQKPVWVILNNSGR